MAGVSISRLGKQYGANVVVDELDLTVEEGEILVLLGPSGCGKTTTLRCIAGLEAPDRGAVQLGDRVVFDSAEKVSVPTHKRDIGMVFQSYALWPHMTVRQNVAYPLRVRRMRQGLRGGWVDRALRLVHCEELADRYPGQLSGGQQQRIALARGLVAQPSLILMDEPLSNLDAKLRVQVRTEIRELHQELKFTAVLVTHDQDEALALGDRIAIMRDGKIEQIDSPERLFANPATEYVASFIGMSNRIAWRRESLDWVSSLGASAAADVLGLHDGSEAVSCVLPEDIRLHRSVPEGAEAGEALVFGMRLVTAEYGGRHVDVTLESDGSRLHARVGDSGAWIREMPAGAELFVSIPTANLHTFAV